jgi:hypothetical protein
MRTMVTEDLLKSKILHVEYTAMNDGRTTLCHLTLENGFTILGSSACVDPENYNRGKGEKYAFEDAVNKIWPLEGYLLKQQHFEALTFPEKVAELCHEVNRAYCIANGDNSQPKWADAPAWQKESAINGAKAHLMRELSPEDSHQLWMNEKAANGWVYGPKKDERAKTHPCMLPYENLPKNQQVKDYLFGAIVKVMKEMSNAT